MKVFHSRTKTLRLKNLHEIETIQIETTQGTAWLRHPIPSSSAHANATPILFVHGFNSSDLIWYPREDLPRGYVSFVELAMKQRHPCWTLQFSDSRSIYLPLLAEEDLLTALEHVYQYHGGQKIHVIAHSMGGLVMRILIENSVPKQVTTVEEVVSMVKRVSFLATPHHGVGWIRVRKVWEELDDDIPSKIIARTYSTLKRTGILFFLVNDFINYMNSFPTLHPRIYFKNAYGMKDLVVGKKSPRLSPDEVMPGTTIEQRAFDVDHMEYPLFSSVLDYIKDWISIAETRFKSNIQINIPKEQLQRIPINRSKDVFDWIMAPSSHLLMNIA